jgi:hypothetical protein
VVLLGLALALDGLSDPGESPVRKRGALGNMKRDVVIDALVIPEGTDLGLEHSEHLLQSEQAVVGEDVVRREDRAEPSRVTAGQPAAIAQMMTRSRRLSSSVGCRSGVTISRTVAVGWLM